MPLVNSFVEAKDFQKTWDDFRVVASYLRQQTSLVQLAIFD
jgi:uncharacterized protein YozE (UPF0346 family)